MSTYATFNPADINANLSLIGGNLTVTWNSGSWGSVRSTISKTSGKWYWEYVFSASAANEHLGGFAKSTADITTYIGSDANGWSYYSKNTSSKVNNGSFTAYGTTYTTETIGVALDIDGGTVEFFKNNVSQGVAFSSGITGAMYAAISLVEAGTVTANFGATTLTYTPPSGFNAGLFDGTVTVLPHKTLIGVGI